MSTKQIESGLTKIAMSFSIKPFDASVTAETLRDALSKLGVVQVESQASIVMRSIPDDYQQSVVIYVSPDDEEPYLLVSEPGERDGRELSEKEVDALRYFGVCTAFHGEYPRADSYGAPRFASDDTAAEAIVADHRFTVNADGLDVTSEDTGDDSVEAYWLEIDIPDDLFEELQAAS